MAPAVKGQAHPYPQLCACPPGTHPGPPEDRALKPRCQIWSGATTRQTSGTWGRHHRALGRKEVLSQMARAGTSDNHTHCPSTTQPRPTAHHSLAGLTGAGLSGFVTGHQSTWGKCGDPLGVSVSSEKPPTVPTQRTKIAMKLGVGSMPELVSYVWSWVEPAHLGSHWLSPLQKDCHSCYTGGRGLLGDRNTARCGGHMNARWSPQGSSHTGGMSRCPAVGSGTPV